MKYIKTIAQITGIFLCSASVTLAQNTAWLNSVASATTGAITRLVALLVGLAVVYFLWGLVVFVANAGNDQARAEGRKTMLWGIIFIFSIVSVWGLVALMQTLTGVSSGTTPGAPRTTY